MIYTSHLFQGKKVNSPIASISTEIGKAMDMIGKSLNNSTMIVSFAVGWIKKIPIYSLERS